MYMLRPKKGAFRKLTLTFSYEPIIIGLIQYQLNYYIVYNNKNYCKQHKHNYLFFNGLPFFFPQVIFTSNNKHRFNCMTKMFS